jgi:hypothetical protein
MLLVCLGLEVAFESLGNLLGEIDSAVLALRYGVQLYRIYTLVRQSRELRMIHDLGEIRLDDLDLSEEIDVYYQQKPQPKAH